MALMVPDAVPSKASEGEKRLFRILHYELPDDCYVWYEPRVKGIHPDFIIVGPTLGLLVLEVKGWSASQILSADNNFFEIKNGNERSEKQQSPLRQGKGYIDACMDKLKQYSILTQPDGDYQGKLCFPVGFGAVMPNMTAAQAKDENIYPLLEQPQVAYRDELLDWDGMGDRELMRRLESMFTARFKFLGLTGDQISTIKGILHPEKTIREKPATEQSVPTGTKLQPDSSVIVTIDREQECLAADIRDGHRLFYGVAGSGKTLILLSRAKLLANRLFNHRVLILCFNITLASYLRSLVYEDEQNPHFRERIEIVHFHDWAKSILGRLPNPEQVTGDYDEVLGAKLLEAIAELPTEQKWDSILVDEAHTFAPSWFRCCAEALKDPKNGDLLIVSDGSQSLYERQKFTWKSVGIQAQGRSKKLNQNYRNTQEILAAAWSIVQPVQAEGDEEEATFPIVEPSAARRQGARPVLHLADSRAQEVAAAIAEVKRLHEAGYDPKDIAILYRYKTQTDTPLFDSLRQQLTDSVLGCYWVTETKQTREKYSTNKEGVRLITALSSLGLEFKAVVILWVEQFGDRHSQEAEQAALARRQLYVAMTRAQESLYLLGSGKAPLLDELKESGCLELKTELKSLLV
jgi:hypothetical protein